MWNNNHIGGCYEYHHCRQRKSGSHADAAAVCRRPRHHIDRYRCPSIGGITGRLIGRVSRNGGVWARHRGRGALSRGRGGIIRLGRAAGSEREKRSGQHEKQRLVFHLSFLSKAAKKGATIPMDHGEFVPFSCILI